MPRWYQGYRCLGVPDILVTQLTSAIQRNNVALRNALEMSAKECADYVEWIKQ